MSTTSPLLTVLTHTGRGSFIFVRHAQDGHGARAPRAEVCVTARGENALDQYMVSFFRFLFILYAEKISHRLHSHKNIHYLKLIHVLRDTW